MDSKLKRIIILIIILILVAINIKIFISNNSESKTNNVATNNNIVNENTTNTNSTNNVNEIIQSMNSKTDQDINSQLSGMSEISRVKTYFGKFIRCIERDDYQNAFNMINDTFKKNKFNNNVDDFKNYINENFPDGNIVVSYDSAERKGEIYVLNVTIGSMNNSSSYEKRKFTIVIRENGENDFSISFSNLE